MKGIREPGRERDGMEDVYPEFAAVPVLSTELKERPESEERELERECPLATDKKLLIDVVETADSGSLSVSWEGVKVLLRGTGGN